MQSVTRLSSIPIVESGIRNAESAYVRIKKSNGLFNWSLERFESTLFATVDTLRPGFKFFEGTISNFDTLVCRGLDLMEHRIPNIYLPPTLMYFNTREYMSDHLVRPVVKRAESFKELGNSVLDSPLDRLDHFVDAADKYVERYLPRSQEDRDEPDNVDENKNNKNGNGSGSCAATETHVIQTYHRGQRFSKKLKRRLTIRTIAEAKALKKQSREAIHILFYAAELIVTDPKQAYQKTKELWAYLSEPEPGNQARPETLEQLVVLLTRETARRVVHFINFTRNAVVCFPETLKKTQYTMMQLLIQATTSLASLIRSRPITNRINHEVEALQNRVSHLYLDVQNYATNCLVNRRRRVGASGNSGHSMALLPFLHILPTSTNEEHDQQLETFNHHRLIPTNHTSIPKEFHLNFQCSIHTVISAEKVAIFVSGRLSEEKAWEARRVATQAATTAAVQSSVPALEHHKSSNGIE